MANPVVLLFALMAAVADPSGVGTAPPPNVLLIIADDVGVDRVAAYGEHPNPGNTPVLDQLASQGMLFRNVWSNPVCSSTRATMMTGRYSFRTGIGLFLDPTDNSELALAETTLPEILPSVYRKVAVGKWHLTTNVTSGAQHPMLSGFEFHRGSIFNIIGKSTYYDWPKNIDGVITTSTTYATTDSVDEALGFIAQFGQAPNPEPWFMWLAFNAAHTPYHYPPQNLHSFQLPPTINDLPLFTKAAIEAMDTEIGRLLTTMDPTVLANTYVIFIGDNGTGEEATTPPFPPKHAKKTTFEGGLNVPLIITGPGVTAGTECGALVNTTDIFATVAEIVGVESTAEDSRSLVSYFAEPNKASIRRWVYADMFVPDQTVLSDERERAARDVRFKLRRVLGTGDTLFDLLSDPFEDVDLIAAGPLSPAAQTAFDDLDAVLDSLDPILGNTWFDVGYGLAGTNGTPSLTGEGKLAGGDAFALTVEGALAKSPLFLLTGTSYDVTAFQGGLLVPATPTAVAGSTDDTGKYVLSGTWPAGLQPGFTLYYQSWISDPVGPAGFSATNGITGTTPPP